MSVEVTLPICLNCGSHTHRKTAQFCSNSCQCTYQYKQYIERWKQGLESGLKGYNVSNHIRRYLFEKYQNRCSKCGWGQIHPCTGSIPLEVHHIDGNYQNNSDDNLELLCPNCHALTCTYKKQNKIGRKGRSKYSH